MCQVSLVSGLNACALALRMNLDLISSLRHENYMSDVAMYQLELIFSVFLLIPFMFVECKFVVWKGNLKFIYPMSWIYLFSNIWSVFIYAAMLVYKTLGRTKNFRKLIHLSLQFLSLCLALLGLWAVLKVHIDKGSDNFYSLHSWLGLACLILFSMQVCLTLFPFPMPLFQILGLAFFILPFFQIWKN